MVTYDQSKGAKGQNTVTNEIFTPKPVKCDPKVNKELLTTTTEEKRQKKKDQQRMMID